MKESKYDDFFLFGVVSKYMFMDLPVLNCPVNIGKLRS